MAHHVEPCDLEWNVTETFGFAELQPILEGLSAAGWEIVSVCGPLLCLVVVARRKRRTGSRKRANEPE